MTYVKAMFNSGFLGIQGRSLSRSDTRCMFLEVTHHIYTFLLEGCGLEVKRRVKISFGFYGFCPAYYTIMVCILYICNYISLFLPNLDFYYV